MILMNDSVRGEQAWGRGPHELWKRLPTDRVWYSDDYAQAGFHRVRLADFKNWNQIHVWCEQNFGDNYTWTGSVFWFCTPEDATLFAVTWC